MDVSRYARFRRPGHAVTKDRSQRDRAWMRPETRVGYHYAHAMVDDHSRLAYVELHGDELALTVTGFVERALGFFAGHGITARRLMTDNAFSYTKNRSSRRAPGRPRHPAPDHPAVSASHQRQGRRFHQTMAREWAYGLAYRSSDARAAALPDWIRHYNEQRPHSALGNRPPLTRVRNL